MEYPTIFVDNYDCQSFDYGGSLKFFMFKSEKAVLLIGMLISRDLGQLLLPLTCLSCGSSVTESDAIPRFRCSPFWFFELPFFLSSLPVVVHAVDSLLLLVRDCEENCRRLCLQVRFTCERSLAETIQTNA